MFLTLDCYLHGARYSIPEGYRCGSAGSTAASFPSPLVRTPRCARLSALSAARQVRPSRRRVLFAQLALGIPRWREGGVRAGVTLPADGMRSRDTEGLAGYIRGGKCEGGLAFLTGAGMSVSAGIPDFRSAGGMYDTLRPDLLTATGPQKAEMGREPTTVVSWPLFRVNPLPYLELRRPFILGVAERRWKATLAHWFVRVCHDKGLLRRVYTQNIDGLDYQTGLPPDRVVSVHGCMGTASCAFCGTSVQYDTFKERVRTNVKDIYGVDPTAPKESTPVPCDACGEPGVKPDTVLYGSSLPRRFYELVEDVSPETGDLPGLGILFVVGTSLTVEPANSVPFLVGQDTVRVVVNVEPVGEELGLELVNAEDGGGGWTGPGTGRDVFLRGGCDEVFLHLAEALGWLDDLNARRDDMAERSRELLDEALARRT